VDVLARPVDGLPAPGASQRLEEVALGPGGNGVNTAMALARLGIRVPLRLPEIYLTISPRWEGG